MPKIDTTQTAPADDAAASVGAGTPDPILVSLDEFCARLSETVSQPELIGAFEFTERAAGTNYDTSDAFKARFDVFINKPA